MHSEVPLLGPLDNILNYFNHKEDYLAGILIRNVLMDWDIKTTLKLQRHPSFKRLAGDTKE